MIKKLLFSLSFLAAYNSLIAQTTISSIKSPAIGSIITLKALYLNDSLDMRATGNGVSWDFSSVDTTGASSASDTVVNPSTTPYYSSFPTANIAEVDASGAYAYYYYTANSVELLGAYEGIIKNYSTPMILEKSPMSLGTKQKNTFGGIYDQAIATTYNSGTIVTTYNAFGSVKFYGQTYSNLVCLKFHKAERDSIPFGAGSYETVVTLSDSYSFSTDGSSTMFAYIVTTSITIQDGIEIDSSTTYTFEVYTSSLPNGTTTATTQSTSVVAGLNIAPNPVQNILAVSMANNLGNTTAEVVNSCGQSIRTETLSGGSSSIDLSDLTAGVYLIKFTNGSNQETKRIVKL